MDDPLIVRAVATQLPPAQPVREHVAALGLDVSNYRSWDSFAAASDDEHPSSLGTTVLRRALERSGLEPADVALVISCGTSYDYPATWSLSTAIMSQTGVPDSAIGVDLAVGCLGPLAALEMASGWLRAQGGTVAAIVAAERWSNTVQRDDPTSAPLWGWSDGASAMIVGLDDGGKSPLGRYLGARFASLGQYNGLVRVLYGGTRAPVAPPGVDPRRRTMDARVTSQMIMKDQVGAFRRTMRAARAAFSRPPDRLVCTQTSPRMVRELGLSAGVEESAVCITGHAHGHVGAADIGIGIEQLYEHDQLRGTVFLCAHGPASFGTGVLEAGPR